VEAERTARKRIKAKRRVTLKEEQQIEALIDEFKHGLRGEKLTWAVLERITYRPRQTLERRKNLVEAFWEAKEVLEGIRATRSSVKLPADQALRERVRRLEQKIAQLHKKIDGYDQAFAQLVEVGELRGIDVRELMATALSKVDRSTPAVAMRRRTRRQTRFRR
jgi:hypothetical protein